MSIKDILDNPRIKQSLEEMEQVNKEFHQIYPGVMRERQPLHTVYGGAHLFKFNVAERLGGVAKKHLADHAPSSWTLARALRLDGWQKLPDTAKEAEALFAEKISSAVNQPAWFANTVYKRVTDKLDREPVEDFRIDFEDGFGVRSNKEEDDTAKTAAAETAKGMKEKCLPPFIGIRIKDFDTAPRRAIRTLDIYLGELLDKSGGKLPNNFVITLPKVFVTEHVICLVDVLEELESRYKLKPGSLRIEVMIELTQSIISHRGVTAVWNFVKQSRGRCRGVHFGTYDYTASCDIIADMQTMDNPTCDFAKHVMQVSLMRSQVMLSDGSTNIMPVPLYPQPENSAQASANTARIHEAWRLQYSHILHSLRSGFYQGWDLHPGQIIVRYATCYAFFLRSFSAMVERMQNFIEVSAQATLVGNVFDDAATGQGLINFFLKAYHCGAILEKDINDIGIRLVDLESHHFPNIVKNYRKPTKKISRK